MGNLATVEVFIYIDGVQIGAAQNPQKKMAQKLAAGNVLAILKEKKEKDKENIELRNTDSGWTDECIGEQMPSVKKANDSAAVLLLELLKKVYPEN
ncbi:hypothetical protein KFK09_027968 [Dendrobium nobile]|uniref:DRBM domain-containing protein n=1 Tax=Dendrobium nobile TaxID=94219 RepID=A0A8T3A1Z2_DENNO|nr:hypothetical protein KFK09_027968 [Dendrobium nobile]